MKFTILFACFLFAVASADHNPFDVLPVDVSGPEDRLTTVDDFVARRDRVTTPKSEVPVDVGTAPAEHHGIGDHENENEASTSVPVMSTTDKPEPSTTNEPDVSTTVQPEEPTTTDGSDSSTTVEPTDVPTDAPTTMEPSSTTEVVPTTTGNPDTSTEPASTSNPTTINPTGPTEGPTSGPTEGPTDKPTTADSGTTAKPDGQSPKGWSTGSIAGVVIGSLFGAAMVVGGILFVSHRMKQRRASDRRPLVEA